MLDAIRAYWAPALGAAPLLTLAGCGSSSTASGDHAIGGTVSGLNGSGLVLEDNGGDDLTVSANGDFTFATKVPGAYAVTVKTEPGDPAQACTVANGSGTGGANVTNVAVTCVTDFTETFDASPLDGSLWSQGEYSCSISGGKMLLRGAKSFATMDDYDGIRRASGYDNIVGLKADMAIQSLTRVMSTDTTVKLGGRWYHTTTSGEAAGSAVGDV